MIPSGYSRNVISGALPNGEMWATSFWCDEAPSDQAATQTQANKIAADLNARWSVTGSPTNFASSGTTFSTLTTYSYLDTTGKAKYVAEAALTGTSSNTQSCPNQVSIVTTLLTGNAGRRNRGRMYWPCNAPPGMTNGELPSAWVDNLAAWLSGTITAVNGDLGGQHVCVLSQVGGTSHSVNAVKVDSRFDIQRRRADREHPAYQKTVTVT